MAWWMGVLFAIGSVCFALGSFPPYATAVGATPDNITYFIGSIFFTTASFLQYMEVGVHADRPRGRRIANGFGSLLRIRHRRIDWWAAGIQLLGTLWFNRTTLSALLVGLGASPAPPPDLAARRAGLHLLPRLQLAGLGRGVPRALRLAPVAASRGGSPLLNLVGSIAFGVSAIASYVTSSGQLLSLALTNLGTFVGAVCFLVGAVLLLPERTLEGPAPEPEPEPRARTERGSSPSRTLVAAGPSGRHRHLIPARSRHDPGHPIRAVASTWAVTRRTQERETGANASTLRTL